jgi:3-hydroxyisobutyrate dehydrogenase-like beta-hydroxyacid dehydrogenase
MSRIALIGAGRIGGAIGRHLLAAGHALTVFDLSETAVSALTEQGASAAASPAAASRRAQVVLVCVGFDAEVTQAALGADGALAAMAPGCCLVVVSTVSPRIVRELAEHAPPGVSVVDAPVVGGEALAQEGRLLVLAGGPEQSIHDVEPVFAAYAGEVLRLGELGAGQLGKSLNNYLLWVATCANDDAARLAEAVGLDWETARRALLRGSGGNEALRNWDRPRRMPWAEKDLAIIAELASAARVDLELAGPVGAAVRALKRRRGLSSPQPTGA